MSCWSNAERFTERQRSDDYKTLVVEGAGLELLSWHRYTSDDILLCTSDTQKGRVVATATLLVERKFVRACGKVLCPSQEKLACGRSVRGDPHWSSECSGVSRRGTLRMWW